MNRLVLLLLPMLALSGLELGSPASADDKGGGWATVKGRVVWGGSALPQRKPLNLQGNTDQKECEKKGQILDEEWVVDPKNKGIRYTFVWLEADPKSGKKKLPVHPDLEKIQVADVEVDQPVCMFVPHALTIREGQNVLVKNTSPIAHNFKWTGDPTQANSSGNVLLPPKGTFVIKGLEASRFPVLVNCNIHPWMKGFVRVFNHPYHAVTSENGSFELKNAPAGEFRLKIWHGSAGWRGGAAGKLGDPITIKAGQVNDLGDISFPPPQ